jgi:hypothetical protein
MEDGLTSLSAVQKGPIWRVRIAWPNGHIHHFGKFISKKDAIEWISAHPWLVERQTIPQPRPANSLKPRYRRPLLLDPAPSILN